MRLTLELPFNSLSFGFCSFNIAQELYKRGISPNIFLIGKDLDLQAYNKAEEDFKFHLNSCVEKARKHFSKDDKGLKLWHIGGSEHSISKEQSLFTFFELDSLTDTEINILNNQDKIFVTSKETKELFDSSISRPVVYAPLGFDSLHFRKVKTNYGQDKIVFSVFGKFERRKNHHKVIPAWIRKYGNNPKYVLHLHVYNPFMSPEANQEVLHQLFQGKKPFNVKVHPFVKTLSELNECFNVSNIVIDMSGAEGFSLPSFHCLGLGKHGVIHNCSAMKDWANEENAVLVESSGSVPAADGVFFQKSGPFNIGNVKTFNDDDFISGCEKAVERYNLDPVNKNGEKLREEFTWKKTVDQILENI